MTRPVRKLLPHQVPGWVPDGQWFFITLNCRERGRNQLCREPVASLILEAAQHHQEEQVWLCQLILLMPDHLHGVISFSRQVAMKKTIADWKKFLARQAGIQWERDFFDHRLRNAAELEKKIRYVRMNPVRLGLCQRWEDWPWVYEGDSKPGR